MSRATSSYNEGNWMVGQSRCSWTRGLIGVAVDLHQSCKGGEYQSSTCCVCVYGDNFLPHSCSATTDWDLAVAGLSSSSTRVACGRAPGMRLYDPVKGEGPVRGFAVVTRSAKRRAEQDAVVACENNHELSGKVAKDQPVLPGAQQPTADCEVLALGTPPEVTSCDTDSHRIRKGGDKCKGQGTGRR